jgi:hypothetical protein
LRKVRFRRRGTQTVGFFRKHRKRFILSGAEKLPGGRFA